MLFRSVRQFYTPFESEIVPATADLYEHEMPGGQYTNLHQQAQALGLADRWSEVCRVYAEVNQMFGDIIKVTPTSKAVGDMALFMVANNLTANDILQGDREFSFPESVLDLIGGRMGQPPGGFPPRVIERVMRNRPIFTKRPGEELPPVDFNKTRSELAEILDHTPHRREVLSYVLYPKVFREFATHQKTYSDTSGLPSPVFFYGQQAGEEISVDIEEGKTLIVKFLTISEPHAEGTRTVFFELNGQPRAVTVTDHSLEPETKKNPKAEIGRAHV